MTDLSFEYVMRRITFLPDRKNQQLTDKSQSQRNYSRKHAKMIN